MSTPAAVLGGRFRPTALLRESPGRQTYLGTDSDHSPGGAGVVIHTLAGSPSPASRARFDAQVDAFSFTGRQVAHLCAPVAAGWDNGAYHVVLPWVPGPTVEEVLADGPLAVAAAVAMGTDLLAALAGAHGRGVLHGDVRPSNIVLAAPGDDLASGAAAGAGGDARARTPQAVLIDVGLAALSRAAGCRPEVELRTARYASPESAGLVDHPPDARSDLYSAAAVIFECLAGRPPFQADTVGGVLRQHLSERAPSLRSIGSAVPGPLDEAVDRMLRRSPDERYTSARAALHDLEAIAAAMAGGRPADLVIGGSDHRASLAYPAFVGRATELEAVGAEVGRGRRGHGGLVLVEGRSGCGKSRLLAELAERSAQAGLWILRGQGVDQVAERPLAALDGVVDQVVRRAGAEPDFAAGLRRALGPHLQATADAVPRLADLLCPGTPGTGGPEAYGKARSLPALSAFLDALGTEQRPALVILDDCQWSDEMTARMVEHWSAHHPAPDAPGPSGGRRPDRWVTVIVAFRAEEVGPSDLLRRLAARAHAVLPGLSPDEVRQLVVSMAGPVPTTATALVGRLSEGNPFMAEAVLRGMVEAGALVPRRSGDPGPAGSGDPAPTPVRGAGGPAEGIATGWLVDAEAMAGVQTSRHAAEFLRRRLDLVAPDHRRLLAVGAVLGKEFDPAMAGDLSRQGPAEVQEAIAEGRRRHLVWSGPGRCSFVHDKIREALLAQLSDDDRRRLHLQAALALEAGDGDHPYELAYHFDAGGDAKRALPHALVAAGRARAQHALGTAEQHYRIAGRGAARAGTEVRRQVAEGLGDVLMLQGRYEEADGALADAATLANHVEDRARIVGKVGELAFKQGDVARAGEALERALRLLGRRMPRRRGGIVAAVAVEIAVQCLHTLLPRLLVGRRPAGPDARECLAIRLYSRLAYTYWFQKGRLACLWAHLREMNLAERYPPSEELAQAYSEHAPVMTMVPGFSRGRAYAERSLQIRSDRGDVWGQGQSMHFLGVVLYASSRFADCIDMCRQAAALLDRSIFLG
ncbi:MAG: AAA family ATPase [Acidimicrobiales bacterium]